MLRGGKQVEAHFAGEAGTHAIVIGKVMAYNYLEVAHLKGEGDFSHLPHFCLASTTLLLWNCHRARYVFHFSYWSPYNFVINVRRSTCFMLARLS